MANFNLKSIMEFDFSKVKLFGNEKNTISNSDETLETLNASPDQIPAPQEETHISITSIIDKKKVSLRHKISELKENLAHLPVNKIKENVKRLTKPTKKKIRVGIEITPTKISYCEVVAAGNKIQSVQNKMIFYGDDMNDLQNQLATAVKGKIPKKAKVNLVLNPSYYRLLLVDAPNVPDEEMKDAMMWRIKDLISEPIDKVTVEIIRLPEDAYQSRMNMVYVAVAPNRHLDHFIDILDSCNIKPTFVDIPELTIKNLIITHDTKCTAMICIKDFSGFINITSGRYLYLTRNIDIKVDNLHQIAKEDEENAELFINEVQRSLDYFESQMGKGEVNKIILLPAASRGVETCADLLKGQFPSIEVEYLDFNSMLTLEEEISLPEQATLLSSISGAIRG